MARKAIQSRSILFETPCILHCVVDSSFKIYPIILFWKSETFFHCRIQNFGEFHRQPLSNPRAIYWKNISDCRNVKTKSEQHTVGDINIGSDSSWCYLNKRGRYNE